VLNDHLALVSVEMAREAVGRTTIECCVHWCTTRCAGSDNVEVTSAVNKQVSQSVDCLLSVTSGQVRSGH